MFLFFYFDNRLITFRFNFLLRFNLVYALCLQEDCPFIVCMTYAFHTPDKLCFILDLMNGGDLHYHLSQHGVFNEQEMRFYAAEVILGKLSYLSSCVSQLLLISFRVHIYFSM